MKPFAVLAFALGLYAWGSTHLPAEQLRAKIYQRATNEFAVAEFFKPAELKTNDLAFSLAPLILQEVNAGKEGLSGLDQFGTLSHSNGVWVLDRSHPAIYWQADNVQINGRAHTRLSYLWCCASAPGGQHADPGALPLQGIRLTLGAAGQPVIWEVLADTSGAQLIYVSQAVEAAAVAEFGKPLPGRRYTIERRTAEAPNVIVARIIDDGPVAMGPIVYVSDGARDVSTLMCRCMPAQAKRLLGTSVYDLLPFQAGAAQSLLTQAKSFSREQTAFWPGDPPNGNQLVKRLRLPSGL